MKTAYDIIIKPVITEQSMEATEDKKYVFQVAIDANKVEIKKAVEEIFGVKVEKVNTIRMEGKEKRQGAAPAGRRAINSERQGQVGTGDRSEKIRTYNFPQDRCTDHRIGLTVHNLAKILDGNLDEVIDALATREQAEKLQKLDL